MNFKQSLIVAIACMAVTVIANIEASHHHSSDVGLLSFMSRSNDLLQRNPTRSLGCFTHYIPLINEITKKYETKYNDCVKASSDGRKSAEEATQGQRNDLANRSDEACKLLLNCAKKELVQAQFECYINGGSENAKTMYGINVNASDELANLVEEYRLIQYSENHCTNETKRTYEKDSAEAYENLNNCILGISEVPTEAPETEAPETVAPETEAPETEAPETEAPETEAPQTDAPETDAPETEAPETEAPETEAPETEAPETEAPETEAPETEAPETEAPETEAPITEAPETEAPITEAPETEAPITEAPETEAPEGAPESEEDAYPEEDISAFRVFKNLKYRLQKRFRA